MNQEPLLCMQERTYRSKDIHSCQLMGVNGHCNSERWWFGCICLWKAAYLLFICLLFLVRQHPELHFICHIVQTCVIYLPLSLPFPPQLALPFKIMCIFAFPNLKEDSLFIRPQYFLRTHLKILYFVNKHISESHMRRWLRFLIGHVRNIVNPQFPEIAEII